MHGLSAGRKLRGIRSDESAMMSLPSRGKYLPNSPRGFSDVMRVRLKSLCSFIRGYVRAIDGSQYRYESAIKRKIISFS